MTSKKALMLALTVLAVNIQPANAADREVSEVAARTTGFNSLNVSSLRDFHCGGGSGTNQDAKNAEFAACVMYVLGAVDMLREWQKIDPAHAPRVCVPRTATSGAIILVVQEHIEATAPWRVQQTDAGTAVIAALAATWPCAGQR